MPLLQAMQVYGSVRATTETWTNQLALRIKADATLSTLGKHMQLDGA